MHEYGSGYKKIGYEGDSFIRYEVLMAMTISTVFGIWCSVLVWQKFADMEEEHCPDCTTLHPRR